MDRQLAQMVRLIDDLLDVSRVSGANRTQEGADRAEESHRPRRRDEPAADRGWPARVGVQIPREPLTVEADPTRLAQVFSNLLNNAAKYTPGWWPTRGDRATGAERRRVTVTGQRRRHSHARCSRRYSRCSRRWEETSIAAQGGLGIGLTLVRRLSEMHGGSVKAESGGMGSRKHFHRVHTPRWRRDETRRSQQDPQPATVNEPAAQRLRVLVVDDNLDGANMLSILVGMHGHDDRACVQWSRRVAEARRFPASARLPRHRACPELDGYEVARRVRAQENGRDDGRVILVSLTGWGSDEDKRRSREAGFDLHLTKPVDAKTVEALLTRIASKNSGAGLSSTSALSLPDLP